MFKKEIFISKQ